MPGLTTTQIFATSGLSGMSAWMVVHPADVLKVRMQLMAPAPGAAQPSAVTAAKAIVSKTGVKGLYAGLEAGLTRQASLKLSPLGIYDEIKKKITNGGATKMKGWQSAVCGLTAGGVASFCSCPIEVCLVRMQADGRLPKEQRMGYTGIRSALWRIATEEGILTYWRGATPTVTRAMVVSMTQLGTYDQVRLRVAPKFGETTTTHLISAVSAAVVYSLASLPLDTVKTRMQSQSSSDIKYTGTLQALTKIVSEEGAFSMWKGFSPYFVRSGGHTVLMFVFKEQYQALAQRMNENR
ncbi:unnamed protein product [Chrysoparadoxa australica]